MEGKESKAEANTADVLNGGRLHTITYTDGRTEDVKVLKVSQRNMPLLAKAWTQEAREIELYLGRPSGWLDTPEGMLLSDESQDAVMELGRELNEGPFGRWFSRQSRGMAVMGVDLMEKTEVAVRAAMSKLTPT